MRSGGSSQFLTAIDGVHGVDLLAYRHEDLDPIVLTRTVVEAAEGPVIVAGSIATATGLRTALLDGSALRPVAQPAPKGVLTAEALIATG